jgi:P4 family phage/plasmid primase-like protien
VLLPHSPNWFSTICLPYNFEECDFETASPKANRFFERNLEMDPERIKLCQEWAGYCLLPDTSFQRFMALEGEGANGKSVYLAMMTAMLGKENCSFVPLERFGERFDKGSTLGKLVNISADSAEMDKIAEGFLKSFTSGDPIHFDRKGIPAIEARPTARLMLAFNNRPRFSDRSSGIWRRMLLVPWRIEIPEGERVRGMDTAEYWINSGELPGILNWAIEGLARLRAQRGFTKSTICDEALEDYRVESNPARAFLLENCEETSMAFGIPSAKLYHFYRKWANSSGVMPLGERQFGKEVQRTFKQIEKKRTGTRTDRYWQYNGIDFSQNEICGEKTRDY